MKNFDDFDKSIGMNEENLFESNTPESEPRELKLTKKFDQFVNEFEGDKVDPEVQQMVDAGEFRIYLGNKAAVALFLNDLDDTPAMKWITKISDTEVRVVLTKDVDLAHEIAAATRSRGLIPQDYNSLDENADVKYSVVDPKQYIKMLEVLPPIYVSEVDGQKVNGGFAVSEPFSEKDGLPTFSVFFKLGNTRYETTATLKTQDNKDITFQTYNDCEFTKGNKATTV